MLHRNVRAVLVGAGLAALAATPSAAGAQAYTFSSCTIPGVCGTVEAFFRDAILSVRISNEDTKLGSALFSAQLIFENPLNAAAPGAAFSSEATVDLVNYVQTWGTAAGGWFFSGVGGTNVLDLAAFFNVFIEGEAASPFRAAEGDPDNGTWVTRDGWVQFSADLSGIDGVNTGRITGLGFCTDQDCVTGAAVVTPEPATMTLVATGLAGVAALRRRRRKKLI